MNKFRKYLSEDEKNKILSMYNTGCYYIKDIANEIGRTPPTVRMFLIRSGVKLTYNRSKDKRKFLLNENYFDVIDTESKAYFLGLLYADGYNNEKTNKVSLRLVEQDKHILESMKKELECDSKLYFHEMKSKKSTWNNCYSFVMCSSKISESLSNKGCLQAKSLILKFPTNEQVPNHLLRHFIRGYFDGDGCLYASKSSDVKITICSTDVFCCELKKYIEMQLNINVGIYKGNSNNNITKNLCIGGRLQVYKFLDWIYKDSNFYIQRKHDKYLKFKE